MVEPISIAASLITLVAFGVNSSASLYKTVESLKSHKRDIRQLKDELQELHQVLQSLEDTANVSSEDLEALKLPLLRCGQACHEFESTILGDLERSDGRLAEFKDWAKLRYLGSDISGFRNMIAGYKGTISIAIADINLRTSIVTMKVVEDYKEAIRNTTSDLEEQLEQINAKLDALHERTHTSPTSGTDIDLRRQVLEEKDSFQQCLNICEQVSAHVNMLKPQVSGDSQPKMPAHLLTASTLDICKETLDNATHQLRILRAKSKFGREEHLLHVKASDKDRIHQMLNSTQECLDIVTQASEAAQRERINIFEDISMAEDGHQVIVSTFGDLIAARRVTVGARTTNWMGQMSDESLQTISRQQGVNVDSKDPKHSGGSAFQVRHGSGKSLNAGK